MSNNYHRLIIHLSPHQRFTCFSSLSQLCLFYNSGKKIHIWHCVRLDICVLKVESCYKTCSRLFPRTTRNLCSATRQDEPSPWRLSDQDSMYTETTIIHHTPHALIWTDVLFLLVAKRIVFFWTSERACFRAVLTPAAPRNNRDSLSTAG